MKSDLFKKQYMKNQFNSFALVDSERKVVETVRRFPAWFALAPGGGSYFVKGGFGGYDQLSFPDGYCTYGDLRITQLKTGKVDVNCVPSYIPIAITGVEILDNTVKITSKGIGGAPDMIRLSSNGAVRFTERPLNPHGVAFEAEYKAYSKVVIGMDDTDSSVKGATFNTALQLASIVGRSCNDFKFIRFTLSLNWPANPAKTTNNASSALVFAVTPGKEEALASTFEKLIRKYTISKETGMVVMDKIRAPDVLKAYARKVKREQVTVEEAHKAAEAAGVRAIPITGERGLIGALAVVGLVDNAEEAITPVKLD